MRTLVIASRNKGKEVEIRQIFHDLPVRWVSLTEFFSCPDVIEDGETFLENARKKAREISRFLGEWALADDSGLEVDALGGQPGPKSARWSAGGDESNNDKLLEALRDVPSEKRTARYRVHMAVAEPEGGLIAEATGVCEGEIGFERKGSSGFGYDPIFLVPEYGKTMAELGLEIKNRISHRARALADLRAPLSAALR